MLALKPSVRFFSFVTVRCVVEPGTDVSIGMNPADVGTVETAELVTVVVVVLVVVDVEVIEVVVVTPVVLVAVSLSIVRQAKQMLDLIHVDNFEQLTHVVAGAVVVVVAVFVTVEETTGGVVVTVIVIVLVWMQDVVQVDHLVVGFRVCFVTPSV
jgi:hypothetical protein